jgi:hypothetical protein
MDIRASKLRKISVEIWKSDNKYADFRRRLEYNIFVSMAMIRQGIY